MHNLYSYEKERPWLFTDEGQRALLKTRDEVRRMLDDAGAFVGIAPARLVELREIREVTGTGTWGQDRIFVRA